MTDDLVKRLRVDLGKWEPDPTYDTRQEAASALESLSAENAALLDDVLRARQERTASIAFWKNIAKIFSGRAKVHLQQRNEAVARADRLTRELEVLDSSHRDLAKRLAVAGEQRNEAFERAAKVADSFADRSLHHYRAVKIAAAIRNLSKES